jgi:hypothetical protein
MLTGVSALTAAQQRVVIGEPARQRPGQVGQLPGGAHPADRQAGQHPPAALPAGQRLDHRRGRPAGQPAGYRTELDPGRFQRPAQPLDLRSAGPHIAA